jgi:hypothetical protein
MKKFYFTLLIASFFWIFMKPVFSLEGIAENLPPILEAVPSRPFQILSTVGAGQKTIDAARLQTQREAIKVNADAIILVTCKEGRMRWEGLVFQKESAYCEGKAIQYQDLKQKP